MKISRLILLVTMIVMFVVPVQAKDKPNILVIWGSGEMTSVGRISAPITTG